MELQKKSVKVNVKIYDLFFRYLDRVLIWVEKIGYESDIKGVYMGYKI